MKTVKVVEFFGEPLNYGGQEAFIKNVYSCINKEKIEFTFITPFECKNTQLREMIKKNGDFLVADNQPFESRFRKKYIINTAKKHLSDKYNVIHIHSGSIFALSRVSKIAKKQGVEKVIVHSHAGGKINLKYWLIKAISNKTIPKYADYYFACSDIAGKWKYSNSVLKSERYKIVKNGVDLEKYSFSNKNRNAYRRQFRLADSKVIINIGRYTEEKNQIFLLDVFNEIHKKEKNAKLVIAGGRGELFDTISAKIKQLGLSRCVTLLLNRSDIKELLDMSDVFVLPSLWEGLPFTGVEAQANGIPCLFSDVITNELNITPSFHSLPLTVRSEEWANAIINLFNEKRRDNRLLMKKRGYSIDCVSAYLERIYEESLPK